MSILRRILYPAYRHLETKVHPLRYLFIEITQRCNLQCRHCGSDCSQSTHFDELTTSEWIQFFQYLGEHADTRQVVLVITGGEPLCHPEFPRILESIKKNGLAWGMVTNGYSLDIKKLNTLLRYGVQSITVSLDGLEDTHNWLRGRKNSFKRAKSALELLAKAPIPFVDVVTCVHPGNLKELPQVRQVIEDTGVRHWRLFSIFPKGRAQESGELILDTQGFQDLLAFIKETRQKESKGGFTTQFCCEGYLPPEVDKQVREEPYFCRAGISIGSVLCDGSISACPNISRSLIQGNIRTDDFLSVWENNFKKFRDRSWMKKGPCKSCDKWKNCLGNSMHLWDEERGHTVRCSYHDVM